MHIVLVQSYTDKPWRDPDTYHLIEQSLKEKWSVDVIQPQDESALRADLKNLAAEHADDLFVFNIAEYLDEERKEGFLPALLDDWGIPHLGSSAEANAIGLDKAHTKAMLKENAIPTPDYFIARPGTLGLNARAKRIGYPLIVKPLREGGHIGIETNSIVYDGTQLRRMVHKVWNDYRQPALVEDYISHASMREFSVGILDGNPRKFLPVEIDYEAMGVDVPILSYEAAQQDQEQIKLVPEGAVRDEIIDLTNRAFEAVGASDYSRVDLRMNQTGCYVLEINIMPGLGPHSFLPEAAKDLYELNYRRLIQTLTEHSMRRWKAENRDN
ncbi:MAG: hypothetical protein JW750_12285 [Anaerolineaceae bacterium]|nr:hypothetical protein [Anaerolineaceae bacterium]